MMLTGCSNPAGTYKFQSMLADVGGIQAELVVGEKYLGTITLTEEFMVLTLEKDGTAALSALSSLGSSTGTWKKTGKNEITLTLDGEAIAMNMDGDLLIFQEEMGKITLKKSK